jgi:hypothetical protein
MIDPSLPGKPAHQMLRPLKNKPPAQMGKTKQVRQPVRISVFIDRYPLLGCPTNFFLPASHPQEVDIPAEPPRHPHNRTGHCSNGDRRPSQGDSGSGTNKCHARECPTNRRKDFARYVLKLGGPGSSSVPFSNLQQVRRTGDEPLFNSLMEQYHYLAYEQPVGEHLKYSQI